MVWVLPCNFDARHCHGGTVIKSNKTINIFNTRRCDSGYGYGGCGFGFGFGGGSFWNSLATGLGFGLGTKLFGGISSWLNGGSFWAGLGFGNQGGYANGGYAGGAGMYPWAGQAGGYYPGATAGAGCNCGCNGSSIFGTGTRYIGGPYSSPYTTGDAGKVNPPATTHSPTPPVEDNKAKNIDDVIDGKDLPTGDELNKLISGENLGKLIEGLKKLTKDQLDSLENKDELANALKNALKDLMKQNKDKNSAYQHYKFTTDFDKLRQLELLCLLDDKVVVDVAQNTAFTGKADYQEWIHGAIIDVKLTDGKLSFFVDNSNIAGEYGLRHEMNEIDDKDNKTETHRFNLIEIHDGQLANEANEQNGKKDDYKLNDNIYYDYTDNKSDAMTREEKVAAITKNKKNS